MTDYSVWIKGDPGQVREAVTRWVGAGSEMTDAFQLGVSYGTIQVTVQTDRATIDRWFDASQRERRDGELQPGGMSFFIGHTTTPRSEEDQDEGTKPQGSPQSRAEGEGAPNACGVDGDRR